MPASCAFAIARATCVTMRAVCSERQRRQALEARREALAFEQLHRDERNVAVDSVLDDLHDVRAAKPRRGLRLPQEPLEPIVGAGVKELDRDLRVERHVVRQPDGAHSSLTEPPYETVTPGDHVTDSRQSISHHIPALRARQATAA